MAIYQLFKQTCQEENQEMAHEAEGPIEKLIPQPRHSSVFSSIVTRFSFLFLLIADLVWLVYTIGQSLILGATYCLTLGKNQTVKRWVAKAYLSLRRALICAVSLLIGLFSPSFGIVVACSYFLMYDKEGIEEVVPAPLQAQFRELM